MKNQLNFTLALVLACSAFGFGQDSIRLDSELSIQTRGQHNLSAVASKFDCFQCPGDMVADNPFFHLAVFTGIDHKLTLNHKYSLETGLYLEERSYSGGSNTISNWVVFPKIVLQTLDTFRLGSRQIGVRIRGGDFWNEDVSDILRLYNIDYQALSFSFAIGRLSFGFMTIGDLSQNIGLDWHQVYKFSMGYKQGRLKNVGAITVNELFTRPRGTHLAPTDVNISNYFDYQCSKHLLLQAQAEVRLSPEQALSSALGIKLSYTQKKLTIASALRYYEARFNQGYDGRAPRYLGGGGRYIGPQLYPLKNFYRNLSQWALYTHRPNSTLIAAEWTAHWEDDLYKKIGVFCDADFNYIYDVTNGEHYFYPSYNAGMQINFASVFNARVSLTNKHMELRDFYQTFALSRYPFLSFGFHMQLESLPLKTIYL